MVIFGSRSVHVKTIELDSVSCASCEKQGFMELDVYRKHAHIFWIPLFPIGKKVISHCRHCKNVLEEKEMPEHIKRVALSAKKETKGPIWQFAGIGLIIALVILINYAKGEDRKSHLKYIAAPVAGDIYEYEIESSVYSTLKVMNVSTDSVFVSPNEYEIGKKSKIRKIDVPANYADFTFGISKKELKEMYDAGEIFNVNR